VAELRDAEGKRRERGGDQDGRQELPHRVPFPGIIETIDTCLTECARIATPIRGIFTTTLLMHLTLISTPSRADEIRMAHPETSPEHGGALADEATARVQRAAWIAIAVCTVLLGLAWQWDNLSALHVGTSHSWKLSSGANAAGPPGVPSHEVLRLDFRPGLDTPATSVRRWWIADPRFGRAGVYVPVGQTPREALTVALADQGIQVVP